MVPTLSFKQSTCSILLSALMLSQISAFASQTPTTTASATTQPAATTSVTQPNTTTSITPPTPEASTKTLANTETPKTTATNTDSTQSQIPPIKQLSTSSKIVTAAAIIITLALLYQHYSADPKEVLEYPEDGNFLDIMWYYFKVIAGSKEIPPHADSITRIDEDNWKINNCKKKRTGLVGYILENGEKIWIPTLGAIALVALTLDKMDKDVNGFGLITEIPTKLQSVAQKVCEAFAGIVRETPKQNTSTNSK